MICGYLQVSPHFYDIRYFIFTYLASWALENSSEAFDSDILCTNVLFLQENEDAVSFSSRVKSEIARQGGLVDLEWYIFVLSIGYIKAAELFYFIHGLIIALMM